VKPTRACVNEEKRAEFSRHLRGQHTTWLSSAPVREDVPWRNRAWLLKMLAVFDTLLTSMLLLSRGATPITVISSIDVPEVGREGGGLVDTGTACAHASTSHKMPDTTSEAMEVAVAS
jgi:hypothetical protein